MSAILPASLIAELQQRIADPKRRHYRDDAEPIGTVSDPGELQRLFEQDGSASGTAFVAIRAQMAQWGQLMPPMHVARNSHGFISASSEDRDALPLAAPATDDDLRELERTIGCKLAEDLRQMWTIADGGWGPGLSHTSGHGPGLLSVKGCMSELADLRRRGAGYTGEIDWPAQFLPLSDGPTSMISYDLESGLIVAFNEYWEDDGLAAAEAFAPVHGSLGAWLLDWLEI